MAAPRAFLDILANAQVRDAYLAGRITLILSPDLNILLWANGAGAHFMGFRTVAESLHAESGLSAAARQAIAAGLGGKAAFPLRGISGERDFLVSRADIVPLGEAVFLRSAAAANAGDNSGSLAVDLTEGLSDETSEAALLDLQGQLMFAGKGFDPAVLAEPGLPAMLEEAYRDGGVKKRLLGEGGIYPVGAVMLNKEPPIFLLIAAKADLGDDSAEAENAGGAGDAAQEFVFNPALLPARFYWQTDAAGRLIYVSPELAQCAGERYGAIEGKDFAALAREWHMEGGAALAELLQRAEPWNIGWGQGAGQAVVWPVDDNEGNGAQAALSALPVYAADGQFKGFRGFGLIEKRVNMVDSMSDDMQGQGDNQNRNLDDKEREAFFAIAKRLSQTMPARLNEGQTDAGRNPRQSAQDSQGNFTNAPQNIGGGQNYQPAQQVPQASRASFQNNGWGQPNAGYAQNNQNNQQAYGSVNAYDSGYDNGAQRAEQNYPDDAGQFHGGRPVIAPPTGQTESEIFAELASSVQSAMQEEKRLRAVREKLRITEAAQAALAEQKARGEAEMIRKQIGEAEMIKRQIDAEAARQTHNAELMRQSLEAEALNRRRAEAESERRIMEEAERQRRSMAAKQNAGAGQGQQSRSQGYNQNAGNAPADNSRGGGRPANQANNAEANSGQVSYHQFGTRQNPAAGGASAPAAQIIPLPLPRAQAANPRAENSIGQNAAPNIPGTSAFGAPIQPLPIPSFNQPAEQVREPMAQSRSAANSDGVNMSVREQQAQAAQRNSDIRAYNDGRDMRQSQTAPMQMNAPQAAQNAQGMQTAQVSQAQAPQSSQLPQAQTPQASQAPQPGTIEAANRTAAAHMSMQAKQIRELTAENTNLRYQRDRLDFLLNAISECVLVLDKTGMVLSSNEAAARLFGRGSENMRGKSLAALFTPAAAQELQREIEQAEAEKSGIFLKPGREADGCTAQGKVLKLRLNFGCLEQGKNYFLLMRDMTRFHDIITSLLHKNNDETEALRRRSRYLAMISHEIRTPLNALLGMAQFIAEEKAGPLNNGKYSEYLGDIMRAGSHIMTLLGDIMDVSKEETWLKMHIQPISLYNVLNDVLGMMTPQANAANIIMRSGVAGDLPPVLADARAVRQILLNLIGNAVHFTPQGGQIVISAHELRDNAAAEQIAPAPRRVLVRISDTGIGMTEAEIARSMRDPLQAEIDADGGDSRDAAQDAAMKLRMKGAGLGLPMVRALADANNADFSLSSEQGRGTSATLLFPVAEATDYKAAEASDYAEKQDTPQKA